MTDHTHEAGASTPHDGDHDPMIADRFRVLERVTPPDLTLPAMAMAVPDGPGGSDPSGRRSGFLVAIAASVAVLIVGIIAVVAVTGGDGTDLGEETGDAADVPVVADDAPDTTAPLVVEGDSGDAADDSDADGSDKNGLTDRGSNATSDSDDGATNATDAPRPATESDAGQSGGPATTTSPDVVAPAADADRPVSTFSTATTDVLPTTGGSGDAAGGTIALRGTVTEVFTDCVSRLLLTETGQVVQGGPVTCDGGSSIVVDGTRVFTSSGFVSADMAFDKHPSNLKPGAEVSVTATRTGGAGGPLTLACDTCRVRIL